MSTSFGIAAFRSRTQVLLLEDALRRAGLDAGVISTPREVAMGCGLSVRFNLADTPKVMTVYRTSPPARWWVSTAWMITALGRSASRPSAPPNSAACVLAQRTV